MATKRVSTISRTFFAFNLTICYSLEGCVRCAPLSLLSLPWAENGAKWADEVINTKDKTTLTGEAKELEQEIELRKEGLHRFVPS